MVEAISCFVAGPGSKPRSILVRTLFVEGGEARQCWRAAACEVKEVGRGRSTSTARRLEMFEKADIRRLSMKRMRLGLKRPVSYEEHLVTGLPDRHASMLSTVHDQIHQGRASYGATANLCIDSQVKINDMPLQTCVKGIGTQVGVCIERCTREETATCQCWGQGGSQPQRKARHESGRFLNVAEAGSLPRLADHDQSRTSRHGEDKPQAFMYTARQHAANSGRRTMTLTAT